MGATLTTVGAPRISRARDLLKTFLLLELWLFKHLMIERISCAPAATTSNQPAPATLPTAGRKFISVIQLPGSR